MSSPVDLWRWGHDAEQVLFVAGGRVAGIKHHESSAADVSTDDGTEKKKRKKKREREKKKKEKQLLTVASLIGFVFILLFPA